jgi:hypothetical protein
MDRDVVRFSHRDPADYFASSGIDECNRISIVDADEDILAVASDGNTVRILADLDILNQLIRRGVDYADCRCAVIGYI